MNLWHNEVSASKPCYQHCCKWTSLGGGWEPRTSIYGKHAINIAANGPFWVEVANPEHPFRAMLISCSRGTCFICIQCTYVWNYFRTLQASSWPNMIWTPLWCSKRTATLSPWAPAWSSGRGPRMQGVPCQWCVGVDAAGVLQALGGQQAGRSDSLLQSREELRKIWRGGGSFWLEISVWNTLKNALVSLSYCQFAPTWLKEMSINSIFPPKLTFFHRFAKLVS